MRRVLRLLVEIPKIEMVGGLGLPQDYWVPSQEYALTFAFDDERFVGAISVYLEPEGVELDWDTHDWETVLEYPLSCTKLGVLIEAECDDESTEREFLAMAQRQTHRYVNGILACVRVQLGQYWVRSLPISALYLVAFVQETKAKWLYEDHETRVLDGIDSLGDRHPLTTEYYELLRSADYHAPYSPLTKDVWDEIGTLVADRHENPEKELIGNAKHHFDTREFRTAAVEAVAALEVGLSSFIRQRARSKGAEGGTSPSADGGLGVNACLAKHLPSVLAEHELDTWLNAQRCEGQHLHRPFRRLRDGLTGKLISSRCIELNTLRNKIVHKGRIPDEKDC
jgi:hypothetical protein